MNAAIPAPVPAMPGDAPALLELMREYYAHDGLVFERERAHEALLGLLRNSQHGRAWLIASMSCV